MSKSTLFRTAQWLSLSAAVVALGSLGTQNSSAEVDPAVASRTPLKLTEQLREDVLAALARNAEAETLAEWQTSGLTPEDIFANARALDATPQLCSVLSELRSDALALFENEIRFPEPRSEAIPCAAELKEKLDQHWQNVSQDFVAVRDEEDRERAAIARLPEPGPIEVELRELDPAAGETLTRGGLKAGEIAFTFDDGPHPTRTAKVLDILEQAGVRANFFSVGRSARLYPALVREEIARGHFTGSHSNTHALLTRLPITSAQKEIREGHANVVAAAGVNIPFFRFPYGGRNGILTQFVAQEKMASFLWNMDTLDWKHRNPEVVYQTAVQQLNAQKGGIILFHDIHEQTVIALPRFLQEVQRRGMKAVAFVPKGHG